MTCSIATSSWLPRGADVVTFPHFVDLVGQIIHSTGILVAFSLSVRGCRLLGLRLASARCGGKFSHCSRNSCAGIAIGIFNGFCSDLRGSWLCRFGMCLWPRNVCLITLQSPIDRDRGFYGRTNARDRRHYPPVLLSGLSVLLSGRDFIACCRRWWSESSCYVRLGFCGWRRTVGHRFCRSWCSGRAW